MFSSVQFLVPGARVLDLFAGSGQLGIEALSRGAKSCLFVDRSAEALAVVKANCKTAGVDRQSDIRQGEAETFLANIRGPFDLALLDPPFHHDTVAAVLPLLAAKMAPGGVVLCETEREADLPEQAGALTLVKQYNYGKIKVSRMREGRGMNVEELEMMEETLEAGTIVRSLRFPMTHGRCGPYARHR